MYSNEKSVQMLVSLLKEYGIKDVIISPGGSDAPIVRSFEYDSFFTCYSVVDERNAAYMAMGMAQELGRPVVCLCTAGTAVCNFIPGITEAFYQNVPVVAITSDQHPYFMNQLELQKIKQEDLFEGVIKKEVTLPCVKTEIDEWQCNRVLNEALLELYHHGKGPIHINVPIMETLACEQKSLPEQRVIRRYDVSKASYGEFAVHLTNKKILVVVGENIEIAETDIALFEEFYKRYNCVFNVETISNLKCSGCVTTYPATETGYASKRPELLPDVIISIGNYIASYKLKEILREGRKTSENWLISASGNVCDPYWSLNNIFEGDFREFFDLIIKQKIAETKNHNYFETWNKIVNEVELGDLSFSSLSIAKILSEEIANSSILHTAILNSTRITQFFRFEKNVKFYSNLGALGIDGCISTFIGHSFATDKISYLLIGDLSFFYGMNGISIRGIKNNVRIILLNNGGGEEFKIKMPYPQNEMSNYICAQRERTAKGWAESLGFGYYTAKTNDGVRSILKEFAKRSDRPLLLELFLNIDDDAKIIRHIYSSNATNAMTSGEKIKHGIGKMIPSQCKEKIKSIVNV